MKYLSHNASVIFENVVDEIQSAEEFESVENTEDYIALMYAIISQCNTRIENALMKFND